MVSSETYSSDLSEYLRYRIYNKLKMFYPFYPPKIHFRWKIKKIRLFFAVFFEILTNPVILKIPLIISEKTHQNLSDYNHFIFKNRFEVNNKLFSSEKLRYSGNCMYLDYAHSFFGEDF